MDRSTLPWTSGEAARVEQNHLETYDASVGELALWS